jgi:importin subunit alpha-6/7
MAERFIPEHRRNNYKAKGQFKPDELRRRREEQQVEIRKQKREENLAKRRNLQITSPTPNSGLAGVDSDDENANSESAVRTQHRLTF